MPELHDLHYGWHRIHDWNSMVFEEGRLKAERQFDALLDQRKASRRKKMPTVPTRNPSIWND